MGAANGTQFRLVDAEVELRRETRDFARWTLADVEELHRRFKKTFGFAVTASQFESLLLLKAPESVDVEEIFDVLDSNRDGRVDGLELLAALACVCRATFEDKARFAFDLFDFNQNGSLSLAELALLMKSVLIGMTLLTGSSTSSSSQSAADVDSSMEAMMLCLSLAENAFSHVDKGISVLKFEDFIAWARSNREFMLQVERFRLIAEKAVGFEDALSLPAGSDEDSDLDMEDWGNVAKKKDEFELQHGKNRKWVEFPPPWRLDPISQPIADCNGMPPSANLQLEWVYGTSGPAARNACRLLATGEAVYFVGSYVVLYSSQRHEQRYYCGHRRAIGCLNVNASGDIVATGDVCSSATAKVGAEIHVWNARNLQCLAVLRNFHPAGVAHVSFPAAASAATATLRQTQALSLGERSGVGGKASAVLSSNLMKKKPHETEALLASVGTDDGASMALWNWQKEAVVASGRAHPAASGTRAKTSSKRPLELALNEDGDEIIVVGAHFVVFHQVGGRFFKHKKPHWHGAVDPPLQTVPVCLSAVYFGIQTVVVGTVRGELLLFERHTLTRWVQAHETQTSVNVCLLSCQSMVLFSAGKDGEIKQWDSTLRPIGQSLDLHALLPAPRSSSSSSALSRPESVLEGDDFRICSLDYDAQSKRFLVATRAGNIFEIDEEASATSSASTVNANHTFQWKLVASGHTGRPTRSLATARTIGGCFASCGLGERVVKIWSLRRRAFVQHLRFPGANTTPSALEFSSDGECLAVGSEDGTVMLARRTGATLSSNIMTLETSMKNTSAAVVAMRFGPLETELLLAVARDNGLIYLYKLESSTGSFSRWMLLKPQADDGIASKMTSNVHALDFSVDGAFLRTQHGSSLYFWDLRQRAGTRVTSMATLYNVQWHTHSISIGWDVSGLPGNIQDNGYVVANSTRGLTLVLNGDGDISLVSFPCPSQTTFDDKSESCWLARRVPRAHLTKQVSPFHSCCGGPPIFGDFALRGNIAITSSHYDPAICQWRIEKELIDVQPRPSCVYDQTLRKRLQLLGLKDIYYDLDTLTKYEDDDDVRRALPRKPGGDISHAVVVRSSSGSSTQRSEAPDLALTLSYVYGLNHRNMSVNQVLACLGNGLYVYGAGPLLIVRHLQSMGTQQRLITSGLEHSVSCLVKHPSEPILAVGSRRDDFIVLLRTEKSLVSGATAKDSFQQVATLKSKAQTSGKEILIAVTFCDANDSNTRSVQSDLAAGIWKNARSHVHTLVFYAWKRQLLLAHTEITQMPVLFGIFTGASEKGVNFVSGGVDHVTFWHLTPATGHVSAQQGVFGRHALVQTMSCAVHVAPFVLTGGEDGCVVVWESSVAAHTIHPSSTSRHSLIGDNVVALAHVEASHVVLGALRNGSLIVWRYSSARCPPRGTRASGSRIQANTFLQLIRVITVYDATKSVSIGTFNTSIRPSDDAYVQGMHLLDDEAVAAVILSNGQVLTVDLEFVIDDSMAMNETIMAPPEESEKTKVLVSFSGEINDIALHPRDLRWASASTDGYVSIWNLHTNLLYKQQVMPSIPRSLAWSATGEHLAVSLSDGRVAILDGTTLEVFLEFTCGDMENVPGRQMGSTIIAKWCSMVKYSPLQSHLGSNSTRHWLALACRDYNIYVYAWENTGADTSPVYSLEHTFVGHTAPIEALDFSLDGQFLQSATSSYDRQLLRWALQKDEIKSENSELTRETTSEWALLDDAWASWTPTFAGPVEGLIECCGAGRPTSLARINSDIGESKDSDVRNWSSPLPVMIVGLDDGHLMLAWYPLTRGDVTHSVASNGAERANDPAVVTKEFMGCFSRGSMIRRVGFSFTNAFVVALARNSSGSTQVSVWKTDYDEELRLRQRFAFKSTVSLESNPSWYLSPVDNSLLDECSRVERSISKNFHQNLEYDKWLETGNQANDEEALLEFIYGINPGATGSRNVFYADDSWEIVYAAGACGVVYNTKTQTQLLNYNTGRHSVISALSVHPKGDLIASGECLVPAPGAQKTPEIVIWDANSGSTVVRIASKHRPGVLLLEFSPDGHRLASIGMESDHTLALYAISGGESEGGRLRVALLITSKTSTRRVWGLSFGEDGELVTCGDQHLLFWKHGGTSSRRGGDEDDTRLTGLKSGLLSSHRECNPQATLLQIVHMSGRVRVVVSSQADGSLYVWKDRVCVTVRRDAHGDAPIPALAVDRKHSLLYSAGADGRICAWNAQLELVRVVADIALLSGGRRSSHPLISSTIQSLAVRDGHVLFTTAGSEVCELVETNSVQPKTQERESRLHVYIRGHATGQVDGLAVHPCKRAQFASAGDDGVVRLWDAATRSLLAFYCWDSASELATGASGSKELRAVAFSADGKHLAVGTTDGVVRVLTATLDAVVTQWSCWQDERQGHAVLSLHFSLDGKLLAVGCQDGTVHVYDAASYRKITRLRGLSRNVAIIHLDFARDRPVLRVQSDGITEKDIRVWELGTWKMLTPAQVRDTHWESKRYPSLVNGTTQSEDFNGAAVAIDGHATPVTNWVVTKNEHFLLSTGGADRLVCQFRLPRNTIM